MIVGAKLKKIREQKRFSQKEIADFLNILQKTYSNIESDRSKISIEQLSKLSEFLDFDLLEFLQEQGLVINQKNEKGVNNGIVHNTISEKLLQQYEARIVELKEIIQLLKNELKYYKK